VYADLAYIQIIGTEETDMSWKTDKELVQETQYGSTREAKNAALTEMKQREDARTAARRKGDPYADPYSDD
jgi:hypothetical protein